MNILLVCGLTFSVKGDIGPHPPLAILQGKLVLEFLKIQEELLASGDKDRRDFRGSPSSERDIDDSQLLK